MSWEKSTQGKDITFEAEEDMSEKYVVVVGGAAQDGCLLPVNGNGATPDLTIDVPVGFIQQTADEGESVPVRVSGQSKAVIAEAITLHTLVGAEIATGRVATLTGAGTWSANDAKPVAYALEAGTTAGEIITVQTKLSS